MDTRVALDPPQLSVEPGGEALCRVRIRNDGGIVDEFTLRVVGPSREWTVLETDSVRLFPGNDGEVVLHLRPPRTWRLAPGPLHFGVRVVPTSQGPGAAVVEEGTVEIQPFRDLAARITPRTSKARLAGRHRVILVNHGNIAATGRLSATDPDESLAVRFARQRFEVPPGSTRRIRTRVRPATVSMTPSREPHGFEVAVTPEAAEPITLPAAMVLRPIVPPWFPVALVAAVVAIAVLVALLSRQTLNSRATTGPVGKPAAAVAPASGARAAAGAGAAAAGAATAGAAAPAAATPAPLPTCLADTALPQSDYYPADGSGVDTVSGRNAAPQSGAAYGAGAVGGDADQAFTFPGGKASVDAGPKVGQLGTSDLCVSLQVKTTQHTAGPLAGNGDGATTGHSWTLGLNATGAPFTEFDDTTSATAPRLRLDAVTPVNDGRWHALAVIRRGRLVDLYVDRVLAATASAAVVDVSSGNDTRFGSDTVTGFTGALDDILIVAG